MLNLGLLGFSSPWILAALLGLPILWWLLRITPPAAQLIPFPAIRLLMGVRVPEETPAASPWWLVLLRLLAAALLIVALAHPLLAPNKALKGQGPVILVIDDGWAAAHNWSTRLEALRQFIDQADRENRPIILIPTALQLDGLSPAATGQLRPSEARILVGAMTPKPWSTHRASALAAVQSLSFQGPATTIWLNDGLGDEFVNPIAKSLQRRGALRVLTPNVTELPFVLRAPNSKGGKLTVKIRRVSTAEAAIQSNLRALAGDGRLLALEPVSFPDGERDATVTIDMPLELRNKIARFELANQSTAASVILTDERWRRRPVGLVSAQRTDNNPSLLSQTYYLERGLAPFNEVTTGPLKALLELSLAVIVVPDGASIDAVRAKKLRNWAKEGGMVLRFAGPRLAQNKTDTLAPTALRRGGRTLGGAMLWTKPAQLAPFDPNSPFANLIIPPDVTVSKQVLAQPALDLNDKTWARLNDGTPLVTAARLGDGWLVLVHTTSNAAWTTLPLSGLFVEMLQRIVAMSESVGGADRKERPLPPVEVLDGFGHSTKPAATANAISTHEDVKIGPTHPPGLYGFETVRRAVNLGPRLKLQALGPLPQGIVGEPYKHKREIDLKPWFLVSAFVLLIVDAFITLILRGLTPSWSRRHMSTVLLTITFGAAVIMTKPAYADETPDAVTRTSLAFVITGDKEVDKISHDGLSGLSVIMDRRSTVENVITVGVNVETDELSFYPMIYWPITDIQTRPSRNAIQRLNQYVTGGGTIFFDLRNQIYGGGLSGDMGRNLRNLTVGLDIPPMVPVPPDHILTKAFYLMQDFPGRWAGGRLWVERPGERFNDGVSGIIVGSNDWAAAWAMDPTGQRTHPVVPGGEQQREMAYRFGINLVMYMLTGNYKSDQVHVPAILERLGDPQ
jgi:hypothetical protein